MKNRSVNKIVGKLKAESRNKDIQEQNKDIQEQIKDSRKNITQQLANDLDDNKPDAWWGLLIGAVTNDPDIPENTKTKLRAKLIQMLDGQGSIDPLPQDKRASEKLDQDIYVAMMTVGGNQRDAKKTVAEQFDLSAKTVYTRYLRHIKRNPGSEECPTPRLDGRKKG